MTDIPKDKLPLFKVNVESVHLMHVRFLDTLEPTEEVQKLEDIPISVSLAFERSRSDKLTVAVGVTVELKKPYLVEVMYAGEFAIDPSVAEEDREQEWRRAAAVLAPIVMYPYLRETIHTLTSRSRSEPLVLPILSFGGISPDDIELPPLPGDPSQLELSDSDQE